MDEQLWFTTEHGLYSIAAGPSKPTHVRGRPGGYGTVAADAEMHVVLVSDGRSPSKVSLSTGFGADDADVRLPFRVTSLAVADGEIWAAGSSGGRAVLARLNPNTLKPAMYSPVQALFGAAASVVSWYGKSLLVRGVPRGPLYCLDDRTGARRQQWPGPYGAAALTADGVLVTTPHGIELLDARECLSG